MPAVFMGQPRDVGREEGITSQAGMVRDDKRLVCRPSAPSNAEEITPAHGPLGCNKQQDDRLEVVFGLSSEILSNWWIRKPLWNLTTSDIVIQTTEIQPLNLKKRGRGRSKLLLK